MKDSNESNNQKYIIGLFLCIAAIYSSFEIIKNYAIIWGAPIQEGGDFAANAIQITNAKSFIEIYGNYSRWGFHHPGPAFFYIYALGERILFDFLYSVASPHQAHLITAIILQSLFISLGITTIILVSGLNKWIGIELLSLIIIHFSIAEISLINIWPPNSLLGPTFAFYPLAVAVSLGLPWSLPLFVIIGCFLVHGHVAQPLFVIPISGIAIYAYIRKHKGDEYINKKNIYIYISILAATIFMVPIVVDIIKFKESNFQTILRHLSEHSQDKRHSFIETITYISSFLVYNKMRDGLQANVITNINFIIKNSLLISTFILCLIWSSFRLFIKNKFYKRLILFLTLGIALCFHWARIQDGIMYGFNSYFFYSIIGLWIIIIYLAIRTNLNNCNRVYSVLFMMLAIFISSKIIFEPIDSTTSKEVTVQKELTKILLENSNSSSFYLYFDHEDWPQATCAAVIIDRVKKNFLVPYNWGFMFGQKHALKDCANNSIVRLHVTDGHVKLPASIYPKDSITAVDHKDVEFQSWYPPEGSFSWASDYNSSIIFDIHDPTCFGGKLKVDCLSNGIQKINIILNDVVILDSTISGNKILLEIPFDNKIFKVGCNILNFRTPDAKPPGKNDSRNLGIAIKSIQFE
jgi:hypothetical protein